MSRRSLFRYGAANTPITAIGWTTRAVKRGGELIASVIACHAERRLHRLAERRLRSLSIRMLKDIGITRSQIPYLVRFGRPTID